MYYEFQYLMKLHYSQTQQKQVEGDCWFQYLMKLHYSQTTHPSLSSAIVFQYLMKLHYSQTKKKKMSRGFLVSVPYEITLLSNPTETSRRGLLGFSTL